MPRRHWHDPTKNLVGFIVGDVQYAVPIGVVREIANPLETVDLPRAAPGVSGVADFRGEIVPVIELRSRFGLPPSAATKRTKWILVEVGLHLAALVVDAVTDVFGGLDIRPAPVLSGGGEERGIVGVTKHAGALVFVIDVGRYQDVAQRLADAGVTGGSAHPPPRAKGGV
jgi:purine-binding chemotaxis protein CheW